MSELNTVPTSGSRLSRNALLAGGGLALAGFGLAAGLMLRGPASGPSAAPSPAAVSSTAPAADTAPATTTAAATAPAQPAAPVAKPVPQKAAPRHETHSTSAQPSEQVPVSHEGSTQRVATCASCGVIEAVRPVQQKGQGTGLGAVAGGVVGGALGNQMGHGNGRAAMTILGAIGGGLAGNEVEKRTRSETVYEVSVRMDDGSLRTITQHTAPAAGTRVAVEGQTLRTLNRTPAGAAEPRLVRTGNAEGV
jgi:outer membrane lipoprotein SlyB